MSLERRLKQATKKAKDAERGRCLWILDEIEKELMAATANRILTPQQLHVVKTKARIAQLIVLKARRGIIAGVEPGGPTDGGPNAETVVD